ncbi:hypothetical protein PsYK624_098700 [Phanerochaete sordida]|uniref:Heterokaryon incompatibility domain-containing protein n=1 Tax=Phanerochaete sordida TaxID=48140 RepID=A0A9P3GHH4_9APHY|nr:hypothetical protein PsYK624_098700 [Phanerochaete sordida]
MFAFKRPGVGLGTTAERKSNVSSFTRSDTSSTQLSDICEPDLERVAEELEKARVDEVATPSKFLEKRRTFRLAGSPGVELQCEDPPWESSTPVTVSMPQYIQQRVLVAEKSPTIQDLNRMNIWGMVKLAEAHVVPEETLFKSDGGGKHFTLRLSTPLSMIPLQRFHAGPGAIPDDLADTLLTGLSLDHILHTLNEVLGTSYTLEDRGVKACLTNITRMTRDFGELYGILRPWWHGDLSRALAQMAKREAELEKLRHESLRATYVQTSRVPLRRVWDLFSNRVIPFHVLPHPSPYPDPVAIPPNVWLVSHAFTRTEQTEVYTTINGHRFPVPIPRTTSLEAIRIELLNLGAEYVWVDILCVRQKGRVEDEEERQQELRIDLFSVGHTFRTYRRPCVVYFSGLGLPLDTSPAALASPRNWLNRVSTLQETTESWLPGGLTGAPPTSNSIAFFSRLKSAIKLVNRPRQVTALIEEVKSRWSAAAEDKIFALAYILRCPTIPMFVYQFYDIEVSWQIFLKHMPLAARTSTFLQYEADLPFEPWVSWKRYQNSRPLLPGAYTSYEESLQLLDPSQLESTLPGQYVQTGFAVGPCQIQLDLGDASSDGTQDIQLVFRGRSGPALHLRISGMHGVVHPGVPYILLGVGQKWKEHWVVIEPVGDAAVGGRVPAAQGIKWGVLLTGKEEGERLGRHRSGSPKTSVLYLDAREGQARTRYADQYMAAFEKVNRKNAKKRRFQLEGSPIGLTCEDAPWVTTKAYGSTTIVSPFAQQRIISSDDFTSQNRIMLWGQVKLAGGRESTDKFRRDLLRSSGPGRPFTLTAPASSDVPMQRMHTGNGVVGNDWAGLPCGNLGVDDLLHRLNDVLGTRYTTAAKPGLRECLLHFRKRSRDLGEMYGMLRPRWSLDFRNVLSSMVRLERDLADLRDRALQGSYINDHRLPPRRVWDLRSNRVLPFHCLPRACDDDLRHIPSNVWTVSHGWVEDSDLQYVWTPINAKEWPVPFPKRTTLDHVRIELLNMGAEYVWLDVLCLRQSLLDSAEKEAVRKEEWKSDVPTIGYIYHESPHRPCITYYNGLGLAFATSRAVLQSPRHWFNRAWTLQESASGWLPGGLTGQALPGSDGFFARVRDVIRSLANTDERVLLIEDMKDRYASTALDKIFCLGCPLQCQTLPIYELKYEYTPEDIEFAWIELIKHMHPRPRTLIFLLQPSDKPFSPWVSWEKFASIEPWNSHPSSDSGEDLLLVDRRSLGAYPKVEGEYYHVGYVLGPCCIRGLDALGNSDTVRKVAALHFASNQLDPVDISITSMLGIVLPDVQYVLVGVGSPWKEHWIVVEVVGERLIRGQRAIEAVKWGVLRLDQYSAKRIESLNLEEIDLGQSGVSVVYLSSEDALGRNMSSLQILQIYRQITVCPDLHSPSGIHPRQRLRSVPQAMISAPPRH